MDAELGDWLRGFPPYFLAAIAVLILLLLVGMLQALLRFRRMSLRDGELEERLKRQL